MIFDRRLLAFTQGERGRIALAALVGMAAVPLEVWRLVLTGTVLARVFQGAPAAAVAGTVAIAAALLVVRAGLTALKEHLANGAAVRVKARLRRRLYEHLLRLGPSHAGPDRRTGATAVAAVDGVERLESFFGKYISQLAVALASPVIIFAFIAALDWQIAAILVATALLTVAVPFVTSRSLVRASRFWREVYSGMGADVLDSVQGLPTLKAFGQSGRRGEYLARRAHDLYRAAVAVLAADIWAFGLSGVVMSVGAAAALAWGAARVQAGTLEVTTLFVLLLLGVEVFRPVRELVALYHQGMWATGSAQAVFAILDAPPAVVERTAPTRSTASTSPAAAAASASPGALAADDGPLEPSVRFQGVTFAYDGRRPAVEDLSFVLRPGESLGVVGASGAGKSTLVNLILRFVNPQQGSIFVGGQDARTVPLERLRERVAVVAQDTSLFHGTVAENLRLGNPDATPAALEAAARAANAHDFVAELPDGYDTVVGERGVKLSGGQRQRLAIARALLKDAPILILDEALSSVDAENEALIQEALDRLRRGVTTLVIAHRLSSVAGADRIIVLDRGRLVEEGTHAALVGRAGGVYARLMAAQQVVEQDQAAQRLLAQALGPVAEPAALTAGARTPTGPEPDAAGGNGHDALPPGGDAEHPLPARRVWWRLWAVSRARLWEVPLAFGVNALRSLASVGVAVGGALLAVRVAAGEPLGGAMAAYLLLVAIHLVLVSGDVFVLHDLAFWLQGRMRVRLYHLLDPLAPAYMQRRRSGDIVGLVTSDLETLELFFAHTVPPLMAAVFTSGAVLVGLAIGSPALALALLPFLVLVALTPFVGGRAAERLGARLREELAEMNAQVVDGVQGMATVLAFGRGRDRAGALEVQGQRLGALQLRFRDAESLQHGAIDVLVGWGSLTVLLVGAGLVAAGQLDRRLLPLATVAAAAAFGPMAEVIKGVKQLMETLAAARRYFAVEDTPVPVRDGPGVAPSADEPPIVPAAPRADDSPAVAETYPDAPPHTTPAAPRTPARRGATLAFEGVSFWYDTPDRPALRGVSFRVDAGRTVALVGRSGAGKTTAAHLVLRFWDPTAPPGSTQPPGRLTLDGHDLRDYTLDDLRRHVALVDQDTYLFNASLMENLRLGRPDATDDEVLAAAGAARVDEFAQSLPDGYGTVVGERGLGLSGGQRQRVAIARALLKDAPLLVLDEATSHLDAANEAEVREALAGLMRGRTTLVIAHRLSTVRDADAIVVLDDGQVAESGTHADLLARDGLYALLVGKQLLAGAGQPALTR